MKLITIFWIILSLTIYSCSQKSQVIEIKNKITELETLKDKMNVSIDIGTDNTNDSLNYSNSFKKIINIGDSSSIRNNVNKYIDSIYFYQYDGRIELRNNTGLFTDLIGVEEYYEDKISYPTYIAKKLIFSDNTVKIVSDTFQNFSLQYNTHKKIKQIAVEADVRYPNVEYFTFDKITSKVLIEGEEVILTKMNDNEVSFLLPSSIEERIVGVNSFYKNRKALIRKSLSGSTTYPKEQIGHIDNLIAFYNNLITKIEKKELISNKDIDNYIEVNIPKLQKNITPMYFITFRYGTNADSIRLFIQNKKDVSYKKSFIIMK